MQRQPILRPKERVRMGTRHGTVVVVGAEVSEVRFDGQVDRRTEYIPNHWLQPLPGRIRLTRPADGGKP